MSESKSAIAIGYRSNGSLDVLQVYVRRDLAIKTECRYILPFFFVTRRATNQSLLRLMCHWTGYSINGSVALNFKSCF